MDQKTGITTIPKKNSPLTRMLFYSFGWLKALCAKALFGFLPAKLIFLFFSSKGMAGKAPPKLWD